jgi:DNA mismatch repair protein MutS2
MAALPDSREIRIHPDNIIIKLEFDHIRSAIHDNCISELGRKETLNNPFITSKDIIIRKLQEVKEFMDILLQDLNFPTENYHNLADILKFIELPDFTIVPDDAHKISQFVATTGDVISFINKNKENYPALFNIIREVEFQNELKHKLFIIIDSDGSIKSNASPKLAAIRNSIFAIETEINRTFERSLNYCRKNEWLAEELESVRNGERVLAFISKYKRKIKGIIFDESITGKTTFIQPESVLDLRNKWLDLKHREKREIFIILRELTRFLRPYLPDLYACQHLLSYIDHVRAKALYSNYIGANIPLITENALIRIINGFHPVLLAKNRISGKKTIAVDLELNATNRILVISGPNAGGKSVCLKTVGLFQLMIQYGLPVTADENSIFRLFDKLFVDIGDDQSIENDLSTYSSRLMNQHFFIRNADERTLFLIDEFGSGTEPGMGGIIAEVLLEKLNGLNSFGLVTTHYTNLKVLAGKTPGLINASMLFDKEMLKPLYKLNIGEPGSSFTLEILENTGFDQGILQSTRERINKDDIDLNSLLIDLQQKKEVTDNLYNNIKIKENQLNKLLEENNKFKEDIKRNKNQLLANSRIEAEDYLQKLIREFEKLVREWKNAKAEEKDDLSKLIRKNIQSRREKIKAETEVKESGSGEMYLLKPGDEVLLKETGQRGVILRIIKDKALALFGNIKTEIQLNRLEKAEKNIAKQRGKSINTSLYSVKSNPFNPVLDVRGFRRDQTISEVEKFLDKAILHDFSQLRIIHGYGDGILREAIRTLLKKYSFIKKVYSEHADHGGDGVTIIEL